MVALALSFLINFSAFAEASEPQFLSLKWKADDSIDLSIRAAGAAILLDGTVKEGGSLAFWQSGVEVTLVAHSNSFVSLTMALTGAENARLVILERQNGRYVVLAPTILGPIGTLREDYNQALLGLEKRKNWDHSLAIRSMLSYFGAHKDKTMAQFRAAVEADQVSLVAEGYDKVRSRFKLKALGSARPTSTAEAPAEKPTTPATKKARREPKPYEPRFEGYRPPRPTQDRSRWQPWYNWFSPRQY